MEKNVLIRKAIINTLGASGANVKNDTAVAPDYVGSCILCEDNTVAPPVEYLPPIWKDKVIAATYLSSQAEVRQQAVVGRLEEVVVASTRYKIEIDQIQDKYETATKGVYRYTYVAPATLTGTAATDRSNLYSDLVTKINNDPRNNVEAFLVHSVAFTTGSTALLAVGEVITQATSLATAIVVAVDVTSGNVTATTAAGTIYLRTVTGTWQVGSLVSTGGTSSGVITTAALLTENQGIDIIDDAGYYAARPYMRNGASLVQLTAGFTIATVELGVATLAVGTTGMTIGLAALYSRGIGSRMLQDVPGYTQDKVGITAGEHEFQLNALPDAAKTYRTWEVVISTSPSDNVLTAYSKGDFQIYKLFTDESNPTNTGTFKTAFDTALGVTSTGA